jgi:beta-mannosidase
MDYYTKWKALQYEVRNAFKPVILSSIQDEEQVEVYLISDRQKEASFDLSGQLVDFEGKTYTSISKKTAVGANSSNVIHQFDLEELSEHVPLNASVLILQLKEEGKIIDELIHFFKLEKDLQLPKDYNLRSKIEPGKNGIFDIFLSSDKFLKGVYLFFDGIEGHFSDNYFDLASNTSIRVQFKPQTKDLTLQKKKLRHLCVQDLN